MGENTQLDDVLDVLRTSSGWQTHRHTYSALYVDNEQWRNSSNKERFVQRDVWQREPASTHVANTDGKK